MDPRFIAFLLLGAMLLSGCSKDEDTVPDGSELPDETRGSVTGIVVDDESQAIEGASIELKSIKVSPIAVKVLTDGDGKFTLKSVPAGRQTITATHAKFTDTTTSVTILPSSNSEVRLVMSLKPSTEYIRQQLVAIQGHYDCAIEYVKASGECDYEFHNTTGQPNPTRTENNNTFMVPPNWGGVLFEITWSIGQGYIDGIRFQLESDEDPGGMFVKANLNEPYARIELNAGIPAPDATLGYAMPQRGIKTYIHVLPLGYQEGATCQVQCGYGVGGALSLEYEVTPTLWFGGPVDKEFSAVQPSG